MMKKERCLNFNHRRTKETIPVRFCSMCGEVVNEDIPKIKCNEEEHTLKRRAMSKYCVDCGEQLIKGI